MSGGEHDHGAPGSSLDDPDPGVAGTRRNEDAVLNRADEAMTAVGVRHEEDVLGLATYGTGDHGVHRRGIFDPELLDRCISCGFCLPACPTYALDKDESSSPRGRITLMRALEAGTLDEHDPTLQEQSSQCLGCRACEVPCPAGVEYGLLLETWRDHQWSGRHGNPLAKVLRFSVARRSLLRLSGVVRRWARTGEKPTATQPHVMLGCAERALFPQVSRAAMQLVPGSDAPVEQGCCGALHAHNGDSEKGAAMARRLGHDLPGTIVTTAGGCAAHIAHNLGRDHLKELSEYLVETGYQAPGEFLVDDGHGGRRRARVTLQDSCHLRNGLRVTAQPRALLRQVADYVELPSAGGCCGSAGTYSVLRPKESSRVLAPKLAELKELDVDYIVTVNPGCQLQYQSALMLRRSRVKAIHLAELLARVEDDAAAHAAPPAGVETRGS